MYLLAFRPKFWLILSEMGLETKLFGKRQGPTGQRGLPFGGPTTFSGYHLHFDRNYWKF